jgi:hypothetical protein
MIVGLIARTSQRWSDPSATFRSTTSLELPADSGLLPLLCWKTTKRLEQAGYSSAVPSKSADMIRSMKQWNSGTPNRLDRERCVRGLRFPCVCSEIPYRYPTSTELLPNQFRTGAEHRADPGIGRFPASANGPLVDMLKAKSSMPEVPLQLPSQK